MKVWIVMSTFDSPVAIAIPTPKAVFQNDTEQGQTQYADSEGMQIDHDAEIDRFYIPVHPNWEIQTKGSGSTFRIANRDSGERLLVLDEHLHAGLEAMARDINASITTPQECPRCSEYYSEEAKDIKDSEIARLTRLLRVQSEASATLLNSKQATIAQQAEVMQLSEDNRLMGEYIKLENDHKRMSALLDEQRLTIVALNMCIGSEGATTTENLTRVGRLEETIRQLTGQLEAAENCIGWVDVVDRLPTESQEVLFVRGDKALHGAWIDGTFWHSNQRMAAAKWMPLPPIDLPTPR